MIESCFDNHLNVQHATDYMGTYLMYLWAINVIVIIDCQRMVSIRILTPLAEKPPPASKIYSDRGDDMLLMTRAASRPEQSRSLEGAISLNRKPPQKWLVDRNPSRILSSPLGFMEIHTAFKLVHY